MQLNQYPRQIAQFQHQLLRLNNPIRRTKETIAVIENNIDRAVLADKNFTNEAQRKCERDRLRLESVKLAKAQKKLDELIDERTSLEIEVEYYQRQYRVELVQLEQNIYAQKIAV